MDTVRIDRFTSRVEADLACQMLRARGIEAYVSADDVAGIHPDIPFGIGGTAVVVDRGRHDEAIALLETEFAGALDVGADHERRADRTDGTSAAGDTDRAADAGPAGDRAPSGADTSEAGDASDPDLADHADLADAHVADLAAARRPGLRVFAVVTALVFALVFLSSTGFAVGWW